MGRGRSGGAGKWNISTYMRGGSSRFNEPPIAGVFVVAVVTFSVSETYRQCHVAKCGDISLKNALSIVEGTCVRLGR